MAAPVKLPTSISPSATDLVSNSTSSSSLSTNLSELSSLSPYFPPDLIPLIASRLTTLQDFFALRAACRTYRAVLTPPPADLASQAPPIIVAYKASASESLQHSPLLRLLHFLLPFTRLDRRDPRLIRFYAFGCRITIDNRIDCFQRHRELHISHLPTGQRARLPDHPEDLDGVIFSGELVLTFKAFLSVLYYCRIGDVQWRAAQCDEGYRFYSLVFVKGTLYGLIDPNCRLAVVELHNKSVELSFLGDESTSQSFRNHSLFWLGECRGELLLIDAVCQYPLKFRVFHWQSGETKWARTTSLGGYSLFFHGRQFAGCLGPDHPALGRDCMYFHWYTGEWWEFLLADDGCWHRHVADNPARAAMDDYLPLAWVLPSIG